MPHRTPPTAPGPTRRHTLLLLSALPLVGVAACSRSGPAAQPVPPGASVLALGDSLTFGVGAEPQTSYPAVLAQLTGWNVFNAGVSGDTSAQGLARLPGLLEAQKPALVIISLGGNDLLRRQPEDALRDNLKQACALSRAAGAQVLLLAIPKPSVMAALTASFSGSLTDHPLYGQLAEELKIPLQRQGWSEVLGDERLKSDTIHANAQGYAQMAKNIQATALAAGLLK